MQVYTGTSADIAETRAYLESLQAMATATPVITPAPKPVVVMTATPASTPARPSRVSRFANWWDNSHVWEDVSGWFKSHWPFGKPPGPPSSPSGGGGSGSGGSSRLKMVLTWLTIMIILIVTVVGSNLAYTAMIRVLEGNRSPEAIERAKVDQQALAPFAVLDRLKACAKLAEMPAYQAQGLPAECSTAGGGVSSPLPAQSPAPPKRPVEHDSTCPTRVVGNQLVRLDSPGCSLQGVGGRDTPAFQGSFRVTEIEGGGQVVVAKLPETFAYDQSIPQKPVRVGMTLSGRFTIGADSGTTFTITAN
jgi:hypothetical protein